jgi:hypothetical protein
VTLPLEVVVIGARDDDATALLVAELHGRLLPAAVRLTASPGTDETLTPLLAGRTAASVPTAYVCERFACRQPVTDPEALRAQLDEVLATR